MEVVRWEQERESNSRNENSARLIIFTYCKTPSRLYRESFNYFSSLFLKLFNANLLPRRVCFFFFSFSEFSPLFLSLFLSATFFSVSLCFFPVFLLLCAGNCNYHFHIVECSFCSLLLLLLLLKVVAIVIVVVVVAVAAVSASIVGPLPCPSFRWKIAISGKKMKERRRKTPVAEH